MKSIFSKVCFPAAASLCALVMASVLISGCSMKSYSPNVGAQLSTGAISGKAMGGEQPIVGGLVTLYNTTTAPYGTGGSQIATTTTGSDGQFSFGSILSCTSGQEVYITISGGNSGTFSTNPQILELAGLGLCGSSSLPSYVNINEVVTIASAYALGNFMSIDGAGFVHISAPAANNNTGTGTTTAAAGLMHAFENIPSLINYQYGTANATVPNGASGGSVGTVPVNEINSLANAFYSCVNSSGSVSGASTSAVTFSTPTAPSAGTGASTTLTANSLTDYGYGNVGIGIGGGTATTFAFGSQTFTTGLTALATAINATDSVVNSSKSESAPTGSSPANYRISFSSSNTAVTLGATNNISGTLVIIYGGTTEPTITVPAGSTPATIAAQVNGAGITGLSASSTANAIYL